jgi:hypothetical protein
MLGLRRPQEAAASVVRSFQPGVHPRPTAWRTYGKRRKRSPRSSPGIVRFDGSPGIPQDHVPLPPRLTRLRGTDGHGLLDLRGGLHRHLQGYVHRRLHGHLHELLHRHLLDLLHGGLHELHGKLLLRVQLDLHGRLHGRLLGRLLGKLLERLPGLHVVLHLRVLVRVLRELRLRLRRYLHVHLRPELRLELLDDVQGPEHVLGPA